MKEKIVLGLVTILVAGVIFTFLHYRQIGQVSALVATPLTTTPVASTAVEEEADTEPKYDIVDVTDWYEVKIAYPENNEAAKDAILKAYESWAKETGIKKYTTTAAAKKALGLLPEQKYAYLVDYTEHAGSGTKSVVYTIETYTGGAHGAVQLLAYNQGADGKVLSAADILPNSQLSKAATTARKQIRQIMSNDGEGGVREWTDEDEATYGDWITSGTKPLRINYSTVWRDGENVVVYFGRYQVASYADGDFEVVLTPTDLGTE
jgi:hypothetical protein